jgi:hypothetical protein
VEVSSAPDLLVTHLRDKLDGQLSSLESARTRAAVALSVSGVVAGLFGPKLLSNPGNLGLAAVAALIVTGVLSIYVLKPHDMTLWAQGGGWLKWAEDNKDDESSGTELALTMAKDMACWFGENKRMVTRVQWALSATFVGVGLQLILWSVAVIRS